MQKERKLRFITELSHKYNLDPKVIEVICNHPFLFTAQKIRELDDKPIRFMYLGKIKLKTRYAKKDSENKEDA